MRCYFPFPWVVRLGTVGRIFSSRCAQALSVIFVLGCQGQRVEKMVIRWELFCCTILVHHVIPSYEASFFRAAPVLFQHGHTKFSCSLLIMPLCVCVCVCVVLDTALLMKVFTLSPICRCCLTCGLIRSCNVAATLAPSLLCFQPVHKAHLAVTQ